ncbi:MAG: SagB/ThcOx family dehydrogenase [Candidatus Binatus sp.]|uniref:SagB/ThcOx family dehydrogenase n=1 Tax=Candidatus Binatus sp. TaxID=2811406 RepID=UPI0027247194|nr:SagB/ThcOx family dehydrogenase [Candidatus Binatus sp.]MDO8431263.1 SagB/ThcOx family dehydrogenase [Candidatus Binatus sp.]
MANDYIDAARVYHELTKHSYTSVRSSPQFLDWDIKPMPYKIYPGASSLALPRDLSLSAMPALTALASAPPADSMIAIDIEALTRILFCADGLTRRRSVGGEDYHFRAAPSAGALYPIEVYVAASEVDGVERGVYHFSPADLRMTGLRRGDWREYLARAAANRPSILAARAVIALTSIYWRSTWKYRARAYRYCFWDAGTMLANLLAAAAAEGISAEVITAFEDPALEHMLGIDGQREGMVALVALGASDAPPEPSPTPEALVLESIPIGDNEVIYNDLLRMHRESRLARSAEVQAVTSASLDDESRPAPSNLIEVATLSDDDAMRLGETILRRGSTRAFAQAPISAEELATIMASSSRHPRADCPRLTETYLIANAVDGLQAGAYYYDREARGFELLKAGNFRGEAGYLCLEQPLGMDCSALVVYMADLERAMRALGNRGYRDAHLEAGIHAGRAYLAAYSLGRGATGLTFYDDDTAKFFSPHAAGKSPLLMLALGVPRSFAQTE